MDSVGGRSPGDGALMSGLTASIRLELQGQVSHQVTPTRPSHNAMAMATIQLWIRFGDEYQHALSIHIHICQQFSLHPFTWLRFLGYAICGGEEVEDYRSDG